MEKDWFVIREELETGFVGSDQCPSIFPGECLKKSVY